MFCFCNPNWISSPIGKEERKENIYGFMMNNTNAKTIRKESGKLPYKLHRDKYLRKMHCNLFTFLNAHWWNDTSESDLFDSFVYIAPYPQPYHSEFDSCLSTCQTLSPSISNHLCGIQKIIKKKLFYFIQNVFLL